MSYRSDIVRLSKYTARYDDHSQSKVSLAQKSMAVTLQRDFFHQHVSDEIKVRELVSDGAVSTMTQPFYQAFAKQVRKMRSSGLRGAGLLAQVDIVVNKWASRGLDIDILEKIRNSIYTLAAPTP
jgi:hypothetical protein